MDGHRSSQRPGSCTLTDENIHTDLVLSPFDATSDEMLAAAKVADRGHFRGVWTFDHFSGAVAGASWSRDPFVTLGAIAAVTTRIRLGVLVANIANRSPAQLASALNTLQGLAPERVVAGLGAGAGPNSRFAVEQVAIGRQPLPATERRQALSDYVESLKGVWTPTLEAPVTSAVVDFENNQVPPIVIGANGPKTIRLAAHIADGVNIRAGASLPERVELALATAQSGNFEVSVFDRLDLNHHLGGDTEELRSLGVTARTLVINAPYDLAKLQDIADRLV